jgi:hypothetical protein
MKSAGRQLVAIIAMAALAAISIASTIVFGWETGAWAFCGLGLFLGLVYVLNRGKTPRWMIHISELLSITGSSEITEDDDPRNLSARTYLPILVAITLLIIVAVLIAISISR